MKVINGGGQKRQQWKNILHQVLRDEFSILRSVGFKINNDFLLQTAISLVLDDVDVPLIEQEVIESSEKKLSEAVSVNFVIDFCRHFNITTRIRAGNKSISHEQVVRKN